MTRDPRDSPTTRGAARAREALEAALLACASLPGGVERAPILAAFGVALGALDDLAERPERERALGLLLALRREVAVADVGPAARDIVARIDEARGALAEVGETPSPAFDGVPAAPRSSPPPAPAPPMPTVSAGVPALHHLERTALLPRVRRRSEARSAAAPRTPAFPRSLSDALLLGAEIEAADERAPESSPDPLRLADGGGDAAHLRRLARNTFEDIGALSLLLRPRGQERWTRGIARFEQRILNDLDFLAGLSEPYFDSGAEAAADAPLRRERFDVLSALLAYTDDELVPDEARAFTRAFVLGCVAGEDAARATTLALRQSHPITHEAQRHALSLASSPAIGLSMTRLAGATGAPVTVALEVLRARREASFETAAALVGHADPDVRRVAARSLGALPESGRAVALLAERLDDEEDDRVYAALVESLVLLGAPAGLAAARARIAESIEAPAMIDDDARVHLLGLIGRAGAASDAEILRRALRHRPGEVESLGWHGHPALIEPLLVALQRAAGAGPDREALRVAAARALHRITGLLPAGSADRYGPASDAAAWSRLYEERRGAFGDERRYRFGLPYTPDATLDELAREDVPGEVREGCAFEVGVLAGGAASVEVDDWSARQRARIEALRAAWAGARPSFPIGGWPADWSARRGY